VAPKSEKVCTINLLTFTLHPVFRFFENVASDNLFAGIGNSRMQMEKVYFWAGKEWKHLVPQDKYEQIILNSLAELVERQKIVVYGFVIVPNHLCIVES